MKPSPEHRFQNGPEKNGEPSIDKGDSDRGLEATMFYNQKKYTVIRRENENNRAKDSFV
jgi:hypothetical protein